MKTVTRNRARIQILSELMSFPTINQKDWNSWCKDSDLIDGDLVSLQSAPATKFYVSWLKKVKFNKDGFTEYLLESIEDGSLCWWSNVSLNVYSREKVYERPRWKWNDDQFKFYDRWNRVCYKWNDAYIVLPCLPEFDGTSVVLSVRIRFGLSKFTHEKKFYKWNKLTMKKMSEFYKECESLYEEFGNECS